MLRGYRFGPYKQVRWENEETLDFNTLDDCIWVDACNLSPNQLQKLEEHFNIRFPSKQEQQEIETSSRYQEENGQTRIVLRLIEVRPSEEGLNLNEQTLSLIWKENKIFSYRTNGSRTIQELIKKLKNKPDNFHDSLELLLSIFGQIVDTDADNIELISQHIYRIATSLHEVGFAERQRIILQTQALQEFIIRIREGLFDIQRVLSSMIRSTHLTDKPRDILRALLKDIASLIDHTNFSFQRLESIQNTILSLINLEQNRIIKIFTVITVVFMPPTLIASIYGMNFRYMPELEWKIGYVFAWALIVGSSIFTLLYFRWKKWL
ncbi:MAG: magnesium/cobalt transporter CorA [Bacteroidia bacterium]|nr:magnesium/cobalt transporter CorA [Bacteroidia bacterium]MDW8134243.1 magnesium/cobalt transporter CorA [Bacteroidia bacterium]